MRKGSGNQEVGAEKNLIVEELEDKEIFWGIIRL
jgi:hypothetical protein